MTGVQARRWPDSCHEQQEREPRRHTVHPQRYILRTPASESDTLVIAPGLSHSAPSFARCHLWNLKFDCDAMLRGTVTAVRSCCGAAAY